MDLIWQQFLNTLELKNVTLVGWSFGCLTIWEYIRQHGVENIKSLVFVDLSPKPLSTSAEDWVEGPLDDIAAAYTTFLQNPDGQRKFIAGYAKDVMVQRELEEDEVTWLVEQSLKTPYYIAANLFAAGMFADYRTEAKIASESVPTLTVVAEHWADVAKSFTEKVSPQSKVEVLGGHLMFWEHSEKFNNLIERFEMIKPEIIEMKSTRFITIKTIVEPGTLFQVNFSSQNQSVPITQSYYLQDRVYVQTFHKPPTVNSPTISTSLARSSSR